MNQLTSGPNPTPDFGYDFDYAVWTPGTRIDLVNVSFNNDYRDVISPSFDIDAYIDSLRPGGISIDRMTYIRPSMPIRIDIPFNRANQYNYLRASNLIQPIDGSDIQKNFYYFILETRYVAPNTTELVIQLDVWQTYVRNVTFGNCYVERGHIGIANEKNFDSFGRDYLTVPEGLDIGSEYNVIYRSFQELMNLSADGNSAMYMVVSSIDLGANPGTADNPNIVVATPSIMGGIPVPYQVLFFTASGYAKLTTYLKDKGWIAQGIVSVTLVPNIARYYDPGQVVPSSNPSLFDSWNGTQYQVLSKLINMGIAWRSVIKTALPSRYRNLNKFSTSPYSIIELTTMSGNPVILKPENWQSNDALVLERPNIFMQNQRIVYSPRHYNAIDNSHQSPENGSLEPNTGDDWGDYIDMFTAIGNLPSLPVIIDGSSLYLANNAYQFGYQRQSADWAQQRAMGSAQANYDVATGAIGNMGRQTDIAIQQASANTAIGNAALNNTAFANTLGGMAQGAVGASVFGKGPALAGSLASGIQGIAGQVGAAIQSDANNQSLAVNNNAARRSTQSNIGQASLARDTNTDLARWAARGDYANVIAGINAKVQQAEVVPPNVNGQAGGETMNLAHGELGINFRVKMIDKANIAKVGEFWLRYGYSIGRFMNVPSSLMVMKKFTYWKMMETYIRAASVPESFKQAIRGILEKGVTVWANPDDVGVIDIADNEPLKGISY